MSAISAECGLKKKNATDALDLMRIYYNGYKFAQDAKESVYNPTLAIYFIKAFLRTCNYPRKMLDSNLAADDAKLRYIGT